MRAGRAPSITKTESPRPANLLQMPRGLMCKLRQRGRGYGGPAGSRRIDPSLPPPAQQLLGPSFMHGAVSRQKPEVSLAEPPTGKITQRFQSRFPDEAKRNPGQDFYLRSPGQ